MHIIPTAVSARAMSGQTHPAMDGYALLEHKVAHAIYTKVAESRTQVIVRIYPHENISQVEIDLVKNELVGQGYAVRQMPCGEMTILDIYWQSYCTEEQGILL